MVSPIYTKMQRRAIIIYSIIIYSKLLNDGEGQIQRQWAEALHVSHSASVYEQSRKSVNWANMSLASWKNGKSHSHLWTAASTPRNHKIDLFWEPL